GSLVVVVVAARLGARVLGRGVALLRAGRRWRIRIGNTLGALEHLENPLRWLKRCSTYDRNVARMCRHCGGRLIVPKQLLVTTLNYRFSIRANAEQSACRGQLTR